MISKTSKTLTIRSAVQTDLADIGRLGAFLVGLHHHFDPKRFIAATPQTPQGYQSFLGSQLGRADVVILVAEREGKVVGYSYAGIEGRDYMSLRGPAGVLYDIVVDREHTEQGIGTMLLEETMSALKALGAPQIVLSTAVNNESAQRLFARAGFRQTMIEMTRELDQ